MDLFCVYSHSVSVLCKIRKCRNCLKPIFHLATLFARREAKTRIRQRDWLKLAGEKIRREQVGTAPTFLCVRANKFPKWKIGLKRPDIAPLNFSYRIVGHRIVFNQKGHSAMQHISLFLCSLLRNIA